MLHLDRADRETLAVIGIWATALFAGAVSVALILGIAVRLFFAVSGL